MQQASFLPDPITAPAATATLTSAPAPAAHRAHPHAHALLLPPPPIRPPQPLALDSPPMPLGHTRTPAPRRASSPAPDAGPNANRSYIPQLIPQGVDPAKVDTKMFYNYVPNTIKTRKRTSPPQLRRLEAVFVDDKKPNGALRKSLAEELGMSAREVQVWFQNRRAKEKKGNATKPGEGGPAPAEPSPDSADTPADPANTPARSPSQPAAPEPDADPAPPADADTAHLHLQLPQLPQHPSPPDASPAAYDMRRSSLPALSLVSFPTAIRAPSPPSFSHTAASVERPPVVLPAHHPSRRASGPVRASNSEGRFAPFPTRRPNLAHRASVPAALYNSRPMPPPLPAYAFPEMPQSHQQLDGGVVWANPDPFNTGGPLPESGYSFGMPPAADSVIPDNGYEFPARKSLGVEGPWDADIQAHGLPVMNMAYRRSEGSITSLGYSDTSASAGTGPYFSDVASEDGDGRRGSCTSTSDMLSGLRVEEYHRADGPGSDYAVSEHGTLTYPSPTSTLDDRAGERDSAAPTPAYPSSSELALALSHSHSGSPDSQHVQDQQYAPPSAPPPSASGNPTFKFPDMDQPSPPHMGFEYGAPSYSAHPHDGPGFGTELDLYAPPPPQHAQAGYPTYGDGEPYPPDGYPVMRYHPG